MDKFTIKDLESLSGIKAHTIRIWEQRYCFLKPCRTPGNIRNYSCEELKTILNIAFLNKHGFKISHIEKMRAEEISKKVSELAEKATASERIINDLLQRMIDLNMESFEATLNDHIELKGIDKTVMEVIFPFLEKTGILHLSKYHNSREHLATSIIRQKLFTAIDCTATPSKAGKTAVIFLTEMTQQELGLLSIYYLLKRNGLEAIYLGTDVSCSDASHVVRSKKAEIIFTHLLSSDTTRFISELRKYFSRNTSVIFSNPKQSIANKRFPGIHTYSYLSEVNNFLSSL